MLAVIEQPATSATIWLWRVRSSAEGCAPHPAAAQVGATNTTLISPVRAAATSLI